MAMEKSPQPLLETEGRIDLHGRSESIQEEGASGPTALYLRTAILCSGRLYILADAFKGFRDARASEAAAGIAYYTIFSLFPLLMILVALGGLLLDVEPVKKLTLDVISQFPQPAQELVERNLQEVVQMGRPVGIIAAAGLIWAATSVFTILVPNIERAWDGSVHRGFLRLHLMALVMVASLLAGLLILSLLSRTAIGILNQVDLPWDIPLLQAPVLNPLSLLLPWALMLITTFMLYFWIPEAKVKRREAGWGALIAASLWWISTALISWYLQSGLSRYQLVYGSLGTVVAFMLWIYMSSVIVLLGAHISAAMGRFRERLQEGPVSRDE